MAGEARQDPATKAGAIKRVADQSGMHLKMTAASLVVRLRMRALPTREKIRRSQRPRRRMVAPTLFNEPEGLSPHG